MPGREAPGASRWPRRSPFGKRRPSRWPSNGAHSGVIHACNVWEVASVGRTGQGERLLGPRWNNFQSVCVCPISERVDALLTIYAVLSPCRPLRWLLRHPHVSLFSFQRAGSISLQCIHIAHSERARVTKAQTHRRRRRGGSKLENLYTHYPHIVVAEPSIFFKRQYPAVVRFLERTTSFVRLNSDQLLHGRSWIC